MNHAAVLHNVIFECVCVHVCVCVCWGVHVCMYEGVFLFMIVYHDYACNHWIYTGTTHATMMLWCF